MRAWMFSSARPGSVSSKLWASAPRYASIACAIEISISSTPRFTAIFHGVTGVVELTALVGYYSMVVMTLNAHEIPLPEGVAPPLA